MESDLTNLIKILYDNEDWLLKRIITYAVKYDYTRYTSTLEEAWKISISKLNEAMNDVVKNDEEIRPPSVDEYYNNSIIDQFSIEEVRKHRSRGVTLGMFLGLVKYYRYSYLDLVRSLELKEHEAERYVDFIEKFFDRFEIGYSVEWNALQDDERNEELRKKNRTLTNEKNKYLTIFESLYDPVILLNSENFIENINQAALDLFKEYNLPSRRYYDLQPQKQKFSWLEQELDIFAKNKEQELIFVKNLETSQGVKCFQVKMKKMQDISEKYRGTVIILNDLTERLAKEEVITLNRNIQKWVSSLVEISHQLSIGMHSDEILVNSLKFLADLIPFNEAVLCLWDHIKEKYYIQYNYINGEIHTSREVDYRFEEKPLNYSAASCSFFKNEMIVQEKLPLRICDQLSGYFWIGRETLNNFSLFEKAIIESIVQQMAIVIEHDMLAKQIQSSAIIEERARLAREMHDGLAQILGFLSLQIQALESLLNQGRLVDTMNELRLARQRIKEAQAEVRGNIYNLRTALSKDGRVIPHLCSYIDEFSQQTGIFTEVDCNVEQNIKLSPHCEVQLVRIIQEALNNIRLHSKASKVTVKFEQEGGKLRVEIEDNGVGFVEKTLKTHIGLQSMRERTQCINGNIEIISAPQHGTVIKLQIPIVYMPS